MLPIQECHENVSKTNRECHIVQEGDKKVELENMQAKDIENSSKINEILKDARRDHANRQNKYVVTPKIDPDYIWVFEDDSVRAIEKLDGTNVSIVVQGGRITSVWNRENPVDILSKSLGYCPHVL